MRYEVVEVTPDVAEQWLAKIPDFQRKLRESVVERYARDMLNENWKITHQGIAFDSKGRLIDGQHRLAAIVKAGVPVRILVVRDAPPNAYDHTDIGLGRTTVDVLRSQGETWITNDLIAVARFMEAGSNVKAVSVARSPFEAREMVETHKNALAFVMQNIERHVRGITIAPVLAAVAVAYYSEMDRVRLSEFVRLLVNGVATDAERDKSVIHLRDWLRDNSGNASAGARVEAYMKTQRVVKAYMTNERLTKLYTPSDAPYTLKRRATAGV